MGKQKIRETDAELKEEAVYQHYLDTIKKHQGRARFLNKDDLYDEVAEPFFVSRFTVARIVRQKLKERKKVLDEGLHKRLKENVELVIDAIAKVKRANQAGER